MRGRSAGCARCRSSCLAQPNQREVEGRVPAGSASAWAARSVSAWHHSSSRPRTSVSLNTPSAQVHPASRRGPSSVCQTAVVSSRTCAGRARRHRRCAAGRSGARDQAPVESVSTAGARKLAEVVEADLRGGQFGAAGPARGRGSRSRPWPSPWPGTARSCSLTALSAASPARSVRHVSSAHGVTVVNQPTVRDRSTPSASVLAAVALSPTSSRCRGRSRSAQRPAERARAGRR